MLSAAAHIVGVNFMLYVNVTKEGHEFAILRRTTAGSWTKSNQELLFLSEF